MAVAGVLFGFVQNESVEVKDVSQKEMPKMRG